MIIRICGPFQFPGVMQFRCMKAIYFFQIFLSLQQTFTWRRRRDFLSSLFMFNTREFPQDPCKRSAIFFLETVLPSKDRIGSSYKRHVYGNCQETVDSMITYKRLEYPPRNLILRLGSFWLPDDIAAMFWILPQK